MQWELLFFFQSAFIGMVLCCIYDIIRSIRNVWKHSGAWIVATDLTYWLGCGIYIFCFLYKYNDGVVRIYEIIAMICGSILYGYGISKYFNKVLTEILKKFKKVMGIPYKCIMFLIKRLKFTAQRVKIRTMKHCKQGKKENKKEVEKNEEGKDN